MLTQAQIILDVCVDAAKLALLKRSVAVGQRASLYMSLPRETRRKLDFSLHVKQFLSTERSLEKNLTPFFKQQIKSMTVRLNAIALSNVLESGFWSEATKGGKAADDAASSLIKLIFDPDEWFAALVDATLPSLARGMVQAGAAQLVVFGLETRKTGRTFGEKATTASEWLANNSATKEDLIEALQATGVDIQLITEIPDWMLEAISEELRNTYSQPYWDEISETTGGDAERFIEEGLENGWSIRRISKEMQSSLGGTAYALTRATRIARTESGNALNGSRIASINKLAEEIPEVPIRPSWLSVLGNTTRASHADLDGVPADENGLWNLDGVLIPWPSHFSLTPGNRINCQCNVSVEFGMPEEQAQQLIREHEDRRIEAEQQITEAEESGGPGVQSAFPEDEVGDGRTLSPFLEDEDVPSQLVDAGEALAKAARDDPTGDVAKAFDDYSRSGNRKLNRELRKGAAVEDIVDREFDDPNRFTRMGSTLDDWSNRPLSSPVTVFRGVQDTAGKWLEAVESGTLPKLSPDLGYGSATANAGVSFQFSQRVKTSEGKLARVIFQIRTNRGAYIESLSSRPLERELVLPRNTTYRIEGVDRNVKMGVLRGEVIVIRMEAEHG